MTGDRLYACLRLIGWSVPEVAGRLQVKDRAVHRMLADRQPIPDAIATWIEAMAEHMQMAPAPPARPDC
jgi:hypothetical protein